MNKVYKHRTQPTFVSVEDYCAIIERLDLIVDVLYSARPWDVDLKVAARLVEGVAARLIDCPTLEECE